VTIPLLLQQAPTPAPPFDPNYYRLESQEQFLIGLAIVVITVAAAFILRPVFAALARRIEGKQADASLRGDVEQLRERLADIDPIRMRVLELEERLEFTERLLAERRDQELLRRGDPQ
jgi:flagellar biosynthesis/type III secretory pathway M-ring protein FliF/YscJ